MYSQAICKRKQIIYLTLIFILVQGYVMYMSTHHVFHDMPPLCPICVASDNLDRLAADTGSSFLQIKTSHFSRDAKQAVIIFLVTRHYLSRGPPLA